MTKFRKDDRVEYRPAMGGTVDAIVRSVHRDKTVTVEARFFLNKRGDREGGYLGYKYRYSPEVLQLRHAE